MFETKGSKPSELKWYLWFQRANFLLAIIVPAIFIIFLIQQEYSILDYSEYIIPGVAIYCVVFGVPVIIVLLGLSWFKPFIGSVSALIAAPILFTWELVLSWFVGGGYSEILGSTLSQFLFLILGGLLGISWNNKQKSGKFDSDNLPGLTSRDLW